MTIENLAAHYAWLKTIYEKYNIYCPSQVFNLDETGFNIRGAVRGKTKLIVPQKKRANALTLILSGSCDHVTVMPVVSAHKKMWNLAILQGKRYRVRRESDGSRKTLHSYFPLDPIHTCVRRLRVWTVLYSVFWATEFLLETEDL